MIGETKTIFIGCILAAIGYALVFFAQNVWVLIAARIIDTVGYQMSYSTINAIVFKRSKASNRGTAASTWMLGMDVGQVAGGIVWGVVVAMLANRSVVFLCVSALYVVCAVISRLKLMPEQKKWDLEFAAGRITD